MSDAERHDEWCVTPCDGPFRVANLEGIVPETVTGVLKDGMMTLIPSPTQDSGDGWVVKSSFRVLFSEGIAASSETTPRVQRFLDTLTGSRFTCRTGHGEFVGGPFTAKFYPKERSIEIAGNGVQIGVIRSDRLIAYNQIVGEDAANSLEHIWRELDCTAPETPPRIQRFLAALTDHEIDFKDDYNYTVKAPFTTTVLPSQNVIIVLGNGVEFGEVRGDDFTPDTAMPCDTRAILRHIWREVIREDALLNRITSLEAECAEKTRRLDQIAAIIKGDK